MCTVDALLSGRDDSVRGTYARLIEQLHTLGGVHEDAKQTCIHLAPAPGATAFAGVHPRKTGILLNLRTAAPLDSPRVRKTERLSRSRYFNEVLVESPEDVDAQLLAWLRDAYALSAG